YHKSAWEPHILPYESDHPRHMHANIIYTMLVRAARLCSSVETFDMERLSTEMILLVNGYPPKFIQQHMKNFFIQHNAMNVWTELNSEAYQQLHNTLLYKPTRRELKSKVQTNGALILNRNNYEHKDQIYLHYTFENGPLLDFKKEYRQIWQKFYVYPGSRLRNTRLILGTILNRTLQSLLIHKKPKRDMLTIMQPTSDQNQNIDSTIDQLLSNDFVTTNQSTIELSTTNTITTENNFIHNPERNQTAARRARPQQHHQQQTSQQLLASPWHPLLNQPVQFRPFQQFQPRRRQQLNQAQRQQHPQQQRQRTEPRRYRRYRQWQERLNQRSLDRQFQTRQTYYRDRYVDYDSDDHLSIEDMHDELLEGYEWEQMDEKTKWEQEHIKDIERLATQDILMITQDEIDQIQQIETAKQITENEKKERNIHLLNQNDLFEQLQFIQLQLRQP
ncbi:unnamed protein product, partial [Rotaria sordida]